MWVYWLGFYLFFLFFNMDKFAIGFFRPYCISQVWVNVLWDGKWVDCAECLLWNVSIKFVVMEDWMTCLVDNIRMCSQEFYDSLIKDLKFL